MKKTFTNYQNRIETDILNKLKEIAARDDRSQNYLVNKIIREYVEKHYPIKSETQS